MAHQNILYSIVFGPNSVSLSLPENYGKLSVLHISTGCDKLVWVTVSYFSLFSYPQIIQFKPSYCSWYLTMKLWIYHKEKEVTHKALKKIDPQF